LSVCARILPIWARSSLVSGLMSIRPIGCLGGHFGVFLRRRYAELGRSTEVYVCKFTKKRRCRAVISNCCFLWRHKCSQIGSFPVRSNRGHPSLIPVNPTNALKATLISLLSILIASVF